MKPILLIILFFASNLAYSQEPGYKISKRTKNLKKEVSKIIKLNSLFTDSLNWNQINNELALLPLGKNDSADHSVILEFFIKKLRNAGDKHSFFITQSEKYIYKGKYPKIKQPESEYLGKGVGLIKVPSCLTFDNIKDREFANSIREQIKKLDTENDIVGWIVDLRGNGGGNMWPMIAGLNALIEDGIVGYTVRTPNRKENAWISENGKIRFSNEITSTYKVKNTKANIAVLIDSLTGSSGEMTAISFIGLPNVQLFGQPTSGYTTSNSTYFLSDGTQFQLATSYVADRKHKTYPNSIIPDVIADVDAIELSKNWILKSVKK